MKSESNNEMERIGPGEPKNSPLAHLHVSSTEVREAQMTPEDLKNIAAAAQSVATIISFVIGAFWVYRRYIRQQENYPNIEFSADINCIGVQEDWWIVELIALIENKGKVQHKMEEFEFDLNALYANDPIEVEEKWGGQVDFPHEIARGSFLPAAFKFFFIDPGVKAKYSYIARVPKGVHFLILHCRFEYADRRKYGHTAEKTVELIEKANTLEQS